MAPTIATSFFSMKGGGRPLDLDFDISEHKALQIRDLLI